jgi:hypothetical protein
MRIENRKSKIENGFTLLEAVVALAIVELGVVTLLEIFSMGLRLGTRSFARTEAIAYGRQAMDEVLIRREVKDGGEEGSFGETYRWRAQVRPHQEESPLPFSTRWELKEVTLEMRYSDGGRERRVEMRTLRLLRKKGP